MIRRSLVAPTIILLLALTGCFGSGGGAEGGAVVRTVLHMDNYAAVATGADEFVNIWGRSPSATELDRTIAAAGQASSLGFKIPAATGSASAAQAFLEQYRTSTADVVTLVGHNDDGVFRFADGSPLPLNELADAGGPPVAMISCNSMSYADGQSVGIPSAITFTVAYAAQAKFAAKLAARQTVPTVGELQSLLTESAAEAANESGAVLKYTVFGVGASGAGIAIWQEIR